MIELPEANNLSNQLTKEIEGKKVEEVIAARSEHKFAFFFEDPAEYGGRLRGKTAGKAEAFGGRVEIPVEDVRLHFFDGVNIRYYGSGEKKPDKHQLLVGFDDGSALVCTVSMYGGLYCFKEGEFDNFYFSAAKNAKSPLTDAFDRAHFMELLDEKCLKLSVKAFLATEQRIPGLGNGVLQDILLNAKVNPRKKMNTFTEAQLENLFKSVGNTLKEMAALGGRDTERDIYGNPGGYAVKLSKNNKTMICPDCGGSVKKENYLGGSVYYCESCQER